MGAQLARIELQSAFRHIVQHSDLAIDAQAGGYAYFPSTFFMGLEHLHVTMRARDAA
jgi:cytochrome P450